jgi:hypothetical protein
MLPGQAETVRAERAGSADSAQSLPARTAYQVRTAPSDCNTNAV